MQIILRTVFIVVLFLSVGTRTTAQLSDFYSDTLRKDRVRAVAISGTGGYAITMTGLYQLWYKDFESTSFHFFNDNRDWLQMDKAGHAYSAFLLSDLTYDALRFSGLNNTNAALYAGTAGFLSVSTIEFFDAFYDGWGFSWGDIAANATGSALFTAQQIAWEEQRIRMKFSFSRTTYPQYRPGTLGSNYIEEMTKDYNGQSYWLSVNPASFTDWDFLPDWLNIAVGYSGDGMLGGSENPEYSNGNKLPHFDRNRQFYLSPDVDFSKIPTRSKALKFVFKALNYVKVPAPAMRLQNGEIRFFGIYR